MNLVSRLVEQAAEAPERVALVEGCGDRVRRVTFGGLAERVRAGAAALQCRGLRQGDLVLFLHPVSLDLYVALLAAMRVGAVAMLVDPGSGLDGLRKAVRRSRPRVWTGRGRGVLAKWLIPALWTLPRVRPEAARLLEEAVEAPLPVADDAPALVTFTSGSTGVPKAAVRSHGFLLEQNRVLGRAIDLVPGECDLVTLPVFALANLAHGVTSVLAEQEVGLLARQIAEERVTRCAASPAFLSAWMDAGVPLVGMRKVFTGGGPVFPPLLDRVTRASPRAEATAVYGSTEAEPIAHLDHREITVEDVSRMRSGGGLLAGRPVPEIRLAIIRDQWGEPVEPMDAGAFDAICLPSSETGEIVVSGGHVLAGYLDGIGDEETKFRVDGVVWHRTGDAGWLDEAGRLWLMGRCSAVVRDERGELFPFAIETSMSFVPHIRRSAVLAVRGRRVLVFESDDPSASIDAPEGIDEARRIARIPTDRRHRAKIDYPALRRLLGDR